MNKNHKKFARGEVYYIYPFPTVGHEQRSGRPAVIVSNNENNAHSGVLEVCYLTLKEKKEMPTHVLVNQGPCKDSTILCEQVTSVAVDKVGDYLCFLPDELMDEVNEALCVSLGLSPYCPTETDSRDVQITSLKHENKHIYEELNKALKELELAKDANSTIKENAFSFKSKAEMYERMYNDLLDRLVNRGAK